ncbi:MAG: Nramp family divalent metal transporter, partial [Syntrophales bacterium LBB04]|nr:Nramp family divalent metal transporter [Syntrophales bacterium LBB04]
MSVNPTPSPPLLPEVQRDASVSRLGTWRRLGLILAVVGPGIITSNVHNDAGGTTTYSLAGAEFGLKLLWYMLPITAVLIMVQEMSARMGVVSGKGLAALIREQFGAKVTFYLMIGIILTNVANTVAEFAGVAAAMELFDIPRQVSTPLAAVLVWVLVIKGSYKSVEKVFLGACVFYAAYIVSGFLAKPDWAAVSGEFFHPRLDLSAPALIMVIGLVGTTIAPWMQFYLQAAVVDKGLSVENYRIVRWDVII